MAEKITIDKGLLHEVLTTYLFDMFEKNNLPKHNTMWSIAEEIVADIERVNNTVKAPAIILDPEPPSGCDEC